MTKNLLTITISPDATERAALLAEAKDAGADHLVNYLGDLVTDLLTQRRAKMLAEVRDQVVHTAPEDCPACIHYRAGWRGCNTFSRCPVGPCGRWGPPDHEPGKLRRNAAHTTDTCKHDHSLPTGCAKFTRRPTCETCGYWEVE